MTSSSKKTGSRLTLVDVVLFKYDSSFIYVPRVTSGVVNKLLRRVPKGRIKLKNVVGASISIQTKLVLRIEVNGEERWRNPAVLSV